MSNVYGDVFGEVYGDVFAYASPSPFVAPTWTSEKLDLWEFMWSECGWGVYGKYNTYLFRCIKNPIKSAWQMTVGANSQQSDTIIDMLRTDAIASGLYAIFTNPNPPIKRPIVEISGKQYTVNKLENDDDCEPSIRLSAMLKQ